MAGLFFREFRLMDAPLQKNSIHQTEVHPQMEPIIIIMVDSILDGWFYVSIDDVNNSEMNF